MKTDDYLKLADRLTEATVAFQRETEINTLKYAVSLCESKMLSFKNESYHAACDDIKTSLLASIERLSAGEEIYATAVVQG